MNKNRIEVDISKQKCFIYKDNEVVFVSDVLTGVKDKLTPLGVFYIDFIETNHMLKKYDPKTKKITSYKKVNYFMSFYNLIYAFHDTPWRNNYGLDSYSNNEGSEGCVILDTVQAKNLFSHVCVGLQVVIYDQEIDSVLYTGWSPKYFSYIYDSCLICCLAIAMKCCLKPTKINNNIDPEKLYSTLLNHNYFTEDKKLNYKLIDNVSNLKYLSEQHYSYATLADNIENHICIIKYLDALNVCCYSLVLNTINDDDAEIIDPQNHFHYLSIIEKPESIICFKIVNT